MDATQLILSCYLLGLLRLSHGLSLTLLRAMERAAGVPKVTGAKRKAKDMSTRAAVTQIRATLGRAGVGGDALFGVL